MNSPLADLHKQSQAEMQPYLEGDVVSTYGALPLEYAALFRSAAVMDLWHRGVVEVTGEDRLTFLNSMLTAELVTKTTGKAVPAGTVRFAFLLDRKGRLQAEMNVLVLEDRCLLEMDARLVEKTVKELEKYHFREKVTIRSMLGEVAEIGVFGPAGAKAIANLSGPAAGTVTNRTCVRTRMVSAEAIVGRDDLGRAGGVEAYRVLLPAGKTAELWQGLLGLKEPKTIPIGWAAYNAARVEAGEPLMGVDYDETFLPAETGQLGRAVSFTKGCYPGQEIVARMQSHGQCARQVVKVELADDALPIAGQKLFDTAGNEVGAITSSTISPRLSNRAIALAVVKKGFYEVGTELRVPAEGQIRTARVAG